MLTGKPTGKKPLGRPRRRWEDNIRMDLAGNWVDSAQDRSDWRSLVNEALNFRVPQAIELELVIRIIKLDLCSLLPMNCYSK